MDKFIHYFLPQFCLLFLVLQSANAQSVGDLLVSLEKAEHTKDKCNIYKQIAYTYQKEQAYAKSSEYLQKAYELEESRDQKTALQENIGRNQLALKKYQESLAAFEQAYRLADSQSGRTILATMVNIANKQGDVSKAISYNEKLLTIDQAAGDGMKTAHTLNNMAVLYQANNQTEKAQQSFQEALELNEVLYKQDSKLPVAQQNSKILNNMATLSNYMGNYERAMANLNKAEYLANKQLQPKQLAKTKNLKGITYYLQGSNDRAKGEVSQALEIGKETNDKQLMLESYRILSEIEASNGNSLEAQESMKQSLKLQDEIRAEESQRQKALLDKQIETEKRESLALQFIADNKRKALELEQAKLESEKKQQALELQKQQLASLERDKELQATRLANQQLEQQRVQQALVLAEQQLQAQKKQQQIAALKLEQEMQSINLKQKELEDEKQKKAIALLEADQLLKDEKLEKEATVRYFGYGIIALFAVIIAIAIFSFLKMRKANTKLTEQQYVITEKNEELLASEEEIRQNMEELQTTQEQLAHQKEALQIQFQKVTHSINYAETIQNAILPHVTLREKTFPDNFLIYRPKDIVSGDFYWISEQEGKRLVAVIDCTGHGVPGAFMSMIGHNILTEIIEQMGIYDPASILNILHKQVRLKLNQKEGANNDGMDMGICLLNDLGNGKTEMVYAGAKHQLFFVKDGEVEELRSDRKSIGGRYAADEISFSNQTVEFSESGKIYLTSDGFLDQANEERRNFSSRRFMEIMRKNHHKPLYEQKLIFENALDQHQQKVDQRDDITLLAISI